MGIEDKISLLWIYIQKVYCHIVDYCRVISSGLTSITCISGIYFYISNVKSVQIDTNDTSKGIRCQSPFNIYPQCPEIQKIMANLTSTHPEWDCSLKTDYQNHSIFSEHSIFTDHIFLRNFLIVLIISAFIYGISAIIRDCTLIYYKNNLKKISFHPSTKKDFYCSINCALCLCVTVIFDLIFMLCVYPFISICFNINNTLKDNYPNSSYCKRFCNALSYISSSWVGLSRNVMIFCAGILTVIISAGFSETIPSMDPECQCFCDWVFKKGDLYKILGTTWIFIYLSLKFICSWCLGTDYYLYLIQYSIPIKLANNINPNQCTGNMMNQIPNLSVPHNVNANEYQSINNVEQDRSVSNDTERNEAIEIGFYWRTSLMSLMFVFLMMFVIFNIIFIW
eukprot:10150_1